MIFSIVSLNSSLLDIFFASVGPNISSTAKCLENARTMQVRRHDSRTLRALHRKVHRCGHTVYTGFQHTPVSSIELTGERYCTDLPVSSTVPDTRRCASDHEDIKSRKQVSTLFKLLSPQIYANWHIVNGEPTLGCIVAAVR